MKKLLFPLFIISMAIVLSGCATPNRLTKGSSPLEEFQKKVDILLADSLFTVTGAGIKIVSLDNNEVLYERDAKMLLRPASNLKLLTTATALVTLGKNFTLSTTLYADTLLQDSVLHGNIYIKGCGDPDFTSAQLGELLASVKANGIKAINGNIVGDAHYFDDQRWGVGWMWDDEPSGFAAYNSALSVNQNCVEVTVRPRLTAGDSVSVSIVPSTRYVSLTNQAKTLPDTAESSVAVSRKFDERLNVITVTGGMRKNSRPHKELITVRGPEMYFLTLAKEELERQGVTCGGVMLLDTVPSSARLLARHLQPIDSMIVFLNKVSDNLSAENTLKIVGAETYGAPGSTQNGISVVKRVLASFGIDSAQFLMVDGSGVSHYNLLTPEIYVQLLRGMYSRKDVFDLFYASLPNAGVDGSLDTRMRNTRAQNNLHAKTGTIGGVSTLTGYVRTADGELLAFSIMMQNYIGSSDPYRAVQDSIGALMAGLHRR